MFALKTLINPAGAIAHCTHLEALGAEGVLAGQNLVVPTELLQADGALQQVRQVHPLLL